MRFLVTGGSGFIGSHFVHTVLQDEKNFVVNIDRLDPCSTKTLCRCATNYVFVKADINDPGVVTKLILNHNLEVIVHFAARSHVDSSYDDSRSFLIDNVLGTHSVLEALRECHPKNGVRMIHIGTDESYGENDGDEAKTEESLLSPSNYYSSSKSGAEMVVIAAQKSFNLPIITLRCNNAYGGHQAIEKCIPRFIMLFLANKNITIQGSGQQRRSFLHVSDFVSAVLHIIEKGENHHIYNVSSDDELSILELARIIAEKMDRKLVIDYVEDRNFNVARYLIKGDRLRKLGWTQKVPFDQGITDTIAWYKSDASKDYWMEEYEFPKLKLVAPPSDTQGQENTTKRQKV